MTCLVYGFDVSDAEEGDVFPLEWDQRPPRTMWADVAGSSDGKRTRRLTLVRAFDELRQRDVLVVAEVVTRESA